jgi:predicted nucleotidyltransferase
MTREELLQIVRGALPGLMASHGVLHLDLFGSFARGEAGPDSDVDFHVTFLEEPTFASYMGLKEDLESLLGRNVDLVTLKGLKPRIREAVMKGLLRVA